MTDAQVPPQSIESEREALGSILEWAPAVRACIEVGLQPEHFYFGKHGAIYRAQRSVARAGSHPDLLATWQALEAMGLAGEVGDKGYLAELGARTPMNVRTHAVRVIELAGKRAKLDGATKIIEGVNEPVVEKAEPLIREGLQLVASDFEVDAEATSPEELADDFFEFLDSEEPAEVFELPWPLLNKAVNGGYRRGEMSVLSGWTNVGKSLVLDQMLTAFAKQGKSTAIFMTEMSRRQRVARYITATTQIPTERLLLKQLTKEEYAKVVRVLPKLPFSLFEVNGWHHERIAERITFGGFDVAAVDHVTRIPGFEKTETASAVVGRLTEVAVRADLHLILVAQLGKGRVREVKLPRPLRHDLRQTSQLADDAHQILFLHRKQDDKGNFLRGGELYYDKIRNGPGKASVGVELAPRLLHFVPTEPEPQGEQESLELGGETVHDREAIPA